MTHDCRGNETDLLCVVEGNRGEQVVRHMGVCDVVEEVVQESKGAVHCGQGTPQPVPVFVLVVRDAGMSVLQ